MMQKQQQNEQNKQNEQNERVENVAKKVKVDQRVNINITPPYTPAAKLGKLEKNSVEIISVPFNGGNLKEGEIAPNDILAAGLEDQLVRLGWDVSSSKDLFSDADVQLQEGLDPFPRDDKVKDIDSKRHKFLGKINQTVYQEAKKVCDTGRLPLTIGGDHSLGIGTVSAACEVYPDLGVLWVDAHADINAGVSSSSDAPHGSPVAYLLGLGQKLKEFEWLKPCLKPNRIVYIGLRDVAAEDRAILLDHKIKVFSMKDIDCKGIYKVMCAAFDYLGRDSPLHLSFDVDALDPAFAPASGNTIRGGLTFREGHFICEEVHETGRLVSFDLMEVNPTFGASPLEKKTTVAVTCSLIRAALGETLL